MCVFISTTRSCPVVHSEDLKKKIIKKKNSFFYFYFYFYYITSSIYTHREARTFSCYGYWPPKKERKKERKKKNLFLFCCGSFHIRSSGHLFCHLFLICFVITTIINSWPYEVSFDFQFFFFLTVNLYSTPRYIIYKEYRMCYDGVKKGHRPCIV